MKTLLLITSLLSFSLIANELKWVDEQIQAIKPPRKGVSSAQINSIKDPFIFLKKNKEDTENKKTKSKTYVAKKTKTVYKTNKVTQKSATLTLEAIINNSALINGKWYKLNTQVGRYTLSAITRTTATLKHKKKELLLSTKTKSKSLKFKNN